MVLKLGILYERLRKDEILLIEEAKKRGIEIVLINDKEVVFELEQHKKTADIILERCINHSRAMYSLQIFNANGIPTINSATCAELCGSKFLVTSALIEHGIPTPQVAIAFTEKAALSAIENIGYPAVLKPAIGTWGTLLAKVNDREAAEAVVSHKKNLGSYHHSVYYIQEYIKKPGRDIKVFVVENKVVGAVYRECNHWMTHFDKGAVLKTCKITPGIEKLALAAAKAVQGDIVAIDILEDGKKLQVLEVDYTVEFSKYFPHISTCIVQEIISFVIKKAKEGV